jgi:hypothetical protein
LAYPVSSASIGYYCSPQGSQIVCSVTQDQFASRGLDAATGIGFRDVSTLFSKVPNVPNKCKAQITIGGNSCYQGNCVPGCGLNGQCSLQPVGTIFNGLAEGTISGDACIFDVSSKLNIPCCFGEWAAGPPTAWGSVIFYYEAVCQPNWSCGEWTDCASGSQIRECEDGCGQTRTESQNCCVPNPVCGEWGECLETYENAWFEARTCGDGCNPEYQETRECAGPSGFMLLGEAITSTHIIVMAAGVLGFVLLFFNRRKIFG